MNTHYWQLYCDFDFFKAFVHTNLRSSTVYRFAPQNDKPFYLVYNQYQPREITGNNSRLYSCEIKRQLKKSQLKVKNHARCLAVSPIFFLLMKILEQANFLVFFAFF